MPFKILHQTNFFLDVVCNLKHKNNIKTDAEFCRMVGIPPQNYAQIKKFQRNVTIELLAKICTKFAVRCEYLFTGSGPIFNDDTDVYELPTNLPVEKFLNYLNTNPDNYDNMKLFENNKDWDLKVLRLLSQISYLQTSVAALKAENRALMKALELVGDNIKRMPRN